MKKIFKQSALLLRLPALLKQAKEDVLFQTNDDNIGIVNKSIEYISKVVSDTTSKIKVGDSNIMQYTALLYKDFEQKEGTKNTIISYLVGFSIFSAEYRIMLANAVYNTSMAQLKKIKVRGVQKRNKNTDRISVINERNDAISKAEADQAEIEAHTLILLDAIGVSETTQQEVQAVSEKLLRILEMYGVAEELNQLDTVENE